MGDPFIPLPTSRPTRSPYLRQSAASVLRLSAAQVGHHDLDAAVTDVAFSPVSPYDVAAAAGYSVTLVGSYAGNVLRSLSRFRHTAHSVAFKPDGRLLVAGDGDGTAQVFDLGSRAVLRRFRGHEGAVRTTKFSSDGLRVMTGSDDSTVKAWDLATSKRLFSLTDAGDYVRSQCYSPASQHVWMVGSLDKKARLYDLRSSKCIFTLKHGYQVDDVHILPGGVRAVTIGGPEARVWDFFAGGKMIAKLDSHAKAVTSGAIDFAGHTFATGGLDGYVKIHDLSTFRAKSVLSFSSEILSLDTSQDGVKYAAGMADCHVEIQSVKKSEKYVSSIPQSRARREREFEGWGRGFEKVDADSSEPKPGKARYFDRGHRVKPEDGSDYVVKGYRKYKLQDYERSLRKFAHGEALDRAMRTNKPSAVASVAEELIMRGVLTSALAGRDQDSLCRILDVIKQNIRVPQYAKVLTRMLNSILDLYGADFGEHDETDRMLGAVLDVVKLEVRACRNLSALQGAAEAILSASNGAS